MNLDELKTAWREYDSRLVATEEINQKVIASMIRERSVSRIARIRRQYSVMIGLFLFYTICLGCCFFGNPFDFTSSAQFAPLKALMIIYIVIAILLFMARMALNKISLDKQNLHGALVQIIAVYARYRRILKRLVRAACFSSLLLSLSISKIPGYGIGTSVFSALLLCGVILFSFYYVGKKPEGASLGEEEKGFREDLEELKELNPQ